jgi:hypothetical protein
MKKITILVTMLFSLMSNASVFKNCKSFSEDKVGSSYFNHAKLVEDEAIQQTSGRLENCPRQLLNNTEFSNHIYLLAAFNSSTCTYKSLAMNSEKKHIICVK